MTTGRVRSQYTNLVKMKLDQRSMNRTRAQIRKFRSEVAKMMKMQVNVDRGNTRNTRNPSNTAGGEAKVLALKEKQQRVTRQLLKNGLYNLNQNKKLTLTEKKLVVERVKSKATLADQRLEMRKIRDEQKRTIQQEKKRTIELMKQSAHIKKQHQARLAAAKAGLVNAGRAAVVGGIGISASTAFTLQQAITRGMELRRNMEVSGLDAETFQNMAAAAATVGLDGDKIADIFKDFNDKIGDYRLTGGGEARDLYDYLVSGGMDINTLKAMNPQQLFTVMNKEFKRRKTSEEAQTFLFESFANDTILLVKAMKQLTYVSQMRAKYGLNLSNEEIQILAKSNDQLLLIKDSFTRLQQEFALGFLGNDSDVNDILQNLKDARPVVKEIGQDLRNGLNFAVENLKEIITLTKIIASLWAGSLAVKFVGQLWSVAKALTGVTVGLKSSMAAITTGGVGANKGAKKAGGLGKAVGKGLARKAGQAAVTGARTASPYAIAAAGGYYGGGMVNDALGGMEWYRNADRKFTTWINDLTGLNIGKKGYWENKGYTQDVRVKVDLDLNTENLNGLIDVRAEHIAEHTQNNMLDGAMMNLSSGGY